MRRYVLILGLLIAGSASAQAATLHHRDTSHHVEAPRPQAFREAFDFAELTPAHQPDTYHYHGGPKSDATR